MGRKQKKRPPRDIFVAGRRVDVETQKIRHAWKRTDGIRWFLETEEGTLLAEFESETLLIKWWNLFNELLHQEPLPLNIRGAEKLARKRQAKRIAAVKKVAKLKAARKAAWKAINKAAKRKPKVKKLRKPNPAWAAIPHELIAVPIVPVSKPPVASDPMMPLSEKYDMPEYDAHHFGRM